MFKKGQRIRHKKSGKETTFQRVYSARKGVVKIIESHLDLGPINIDQFEAIEDGGNTPTASMKDWKLKTGPATYLEQHERNGRGSEKNVALAKAILGV